MSTSMDHSGFEQIRTWLSQRCGISFPPSKSELLRQRMERVLRRFGFDDLDRLARELLSSEAQDVELAVMHAASINHTYFFREPDVLERFVDLAVPVVQAQPNTRIWSAACSTGEEVYTIAIMLWAVSRPDYRAFFTGDEREVAAGKNQWPRSARDESGMKFDRPSS